MNDPEGPLPRWVYWRRRAVAAAGSVALLMVLVWLLAMLHQHDQPDARGAPAQWSSSPAPTSSTTSTAQSTTPTPSPSSPAPASSGGLPPGAPRPAPVPPPAPPPPPPPPGPCPDAAIRLIAAADRPDYRAGELPEFGIAVVNTGPVACVRDLSRRLRELVITPIGPGNRLWSSNDCYSGNVDGPRLLRPGERVDFGVTWARRTSAPGCPGGRNAVPAGDYLLVARLGNLVSPPTRFRLD
jgi:hypothetical protein